ncbi:PDC sensor domain-containing protein, partial [Campylobacter curvus]|uniref:PDC sensor domain-containing protein n=1 Tax=Campylobacter curvus TaxID=200 RepID=UPI0024B4B762
MRSITNKIALMLVIALFVSFAAISAASYYTAESKVVDLVVQNQDQILKDVKTVANSFFDDFTATVQRFATKVEKSLDYDEQILKVVVGEKSQANASVGDVFFGREADGHHFQSTGKILTPEADNYDPRKRGWYLAAKAANKPIYTEPYIDAINKTLVVTFATPVYKDGKFIGVAGRDVLVDALSKKILEMGKTKYGYVFLINKEGTILMHSNTQNIGKVVESTKVVSERFANKEFDKNGLVPYTNSKGENVQAKILPINDEDWLAVASIGANTFSDNTIPLLKAQLV